MISVCSSQFTASDSCNRSPCRILPSKSSEVHRHNISEVPWIVAQFEQWIKQRPYSYKMDCTKPKTGRDVQISEPSAQAGQRDNNATVKRRRPATARLHKARRALILAIERTVRNSTARWGSPRDLWEGPPWSGAFLTHFSAPDWNGAGSRS